MKPVGLEYLLRTSDVVVVLSALNDQGRGMLGRKELEMMKPNVVFVNVARGGIVDDDEPAALARRWPAMRLAI